MSQYYRLIRVHICSYVYSVFEYTVCVYISVSWACLLTNLFPLLILPNISVCLPCEVNDKMAIKHKEEQNASFTKVAHISSH